jgi:uncharacterized protein YgiB involved in biofilm formation
MRKNGKVTSGMVRMGHWVKVSLMEEGSITFWGPVPTGVLLGQVMEEVSDGGKVRDESLVEVAKPNEQVYPLN